ncbi:hypothetical protein PoB_000429600 [Plakobranchus ocellatus]|uniref:Secreted protein n=1 Tax=Plakobranchus ocellatus TaxID=259542 RepID=A0AAV3Y3J6_9GAST|nr:hypothetical protein PoB_000429600 [Plakobranchus ocellatus]
MFVMVLEFWCVASPQLRGLSLSSSPSSQCTGGGVRTSDRTYAADLRAASPQLRGLSLSSSPSSQCTGGGVQTSDRTYAADLRAGSLSLCHRRTPQKDILKKARNWL